MLRAQRCKSVDAPHMMCWRALKVQECGLSLACVRDATWHMPAHGGSYVGLLEGAGNLTVEC